MGGGHSSGLEIVQANGNATAGQLQCGLAASQSATDNGNAGEMLRHESGLNLLGVMLFLGLPIFKNARLERYRDRTKSEDLD
jgi:hypothetical protein